MRNLAFIASMMLGASNVLAEPEKTHWVDAPKLLTMTKFNEKVALRVAVSEKMSGDLGFDPSALVMPGGTKTIRLRAGRLVCDLPSDPNILYERNLAMAQYSWLSPISTKQNVATQSYGGPDGGTRYLWYTTTTFSTPEDPKFADLKSMTCNKGHTWDDPNKDKDIPVGLLRCIFKIIVSVPAGETTAPLECELGKDVIRTIEYLP